MSSNGGLPNWGGNTTPASCASAWHPRQLGSSPITRFPTRLAAGGLGSRFPSLPQVSQLRGCSVGTPMILRALSGGDCRTRDRRSKHH
jgi:hypothetical protein